MQIEAAWKLMTLGKSASFIVKHGFSDIPYTNMAFIFPGANKSSKHGELSNLHTQATTIHPKASSTHHGKKVFHPS